MAEPQAKQGFLSSILAGTTALAVETCDVAGEVDVDDVTTTFAQIGGVCDQRLLGQVRRRTYNIAGVYDFTADYNASPPAIQEGMVVATFHAKPDGTIDFSSAALVTAFRWRGGPKNNSVRFDATLRSTGALTYPA